MRKANKRDQWYVRSRTHTRTPKCLAVHPKVWTSRLFAKPAVRDTVTVSVRVQVRLVQQTASRSTEDGGGAVYDRREIYKHAPLALVTAEVRFPYSPRLRQEDTLDRIQLALEDLLPVRRTEKRFTIQFNTSTGSQSSTIDVHRFLDRTHTLSLVVSPEAFTVETTRYDEFHSFLTSVARVSDVLIQEKAIPAVDRVGLRYIDEIRVPESIEDAAQWTEWVTPGLLPSIESTPGPLKTSQGIALFDLGDSAQLQFQFAAVNGKPVVSGSPLRRQSVPEAGPFFVLDLDSFWQAETPEKSTDFSLEFLRSTLSRLHAPMGQVFQSALTDRLRDVFRGSHER